MSHYFPPELYAEVLQYVNQRPDLLKLTRTSRTLSHEASRILYSDIDLSSIDVLDRLGLSVIRRPDLCLGTRLFSLHSRVMNAQRIWTHDRLALLRAILTHMPALTCMTMDVVLTGAWELLRNSLMSSGSRLRQFTFTLPVGSDVTKCRAFLQSQPSITSLDLPGNVRSFFNLETRSPSFLPNISVIIGYWSFIQDFIKLRPIRRVRVLSSFQGSNPRETVVFMPSQTVEALHLASSPAFIPVFASARFLQCTYMQDQVR